MKETVPEPGLSAWRALLSTHSAVLARLAADLAREAHLPLDWYDTLVTIQNADEHRVRMRDLALSLGLTRSNATRLIDRLQRAGLVARQGIAGDRRGAEVMLTAAGRSTLRKATAVHAAGIREYFLAKLSSKEQAALAKALGRVSRGAGTAAPRLAPERPRRRVAAQSLAGKERA